MNPTDFEAYRSAPPGKARDAIRNRIVLANMGIVHKMVRANDPGDDLDDLIQAGVLGLIAALEKYDPSLGGFYTFAKWRVLYAVQCAIQSKHGITWRNLKKRGAPIYAHDVAECLGASAKPHPGALGSNIRLHVATCESPEAVGWHLGVRAAINKQAAGGVGTSERDIAAAEARHDLAVVLEGATSDEIEAVIALADGASVGEIAECLAIARREVPERMAATLARLLGGVRGLE